MLAFSVQLSAISVWLKAPILMTPNNIHDFVIIGSGLGGSVSAMG